MKKTNMKSHAARVTQKDIKAREGGRVSNHYIDEEEEQDEDDERRDGMDSDRKRLLDVPR